MPELPEVETIKLELNKLIKGKRIKSVKINLSKQVHTPIKKFLRLVEGRIVVGVRRRAKVLIIDLDNNYHLIFHLKMTGQLIYGNKDILAGGGHPIEHNLKELPNKYSHVIFNFADSSRLFFNDTRQFGWVKLVNNMELDELSEAFGPEPLEIASFQEFKNLFESRRGAVKPLLMNPKVIAGIGNIYAAEGCFCACISPSRAVNTLSDKELDRLYSCLKKILKLAIKNKGTSAKNYVDAFGRQGSMEEFLKVYGRGGKKCVKCKSVLKSIEQGQRSTVYCEKCQK